MSDENIAGEAKPPITPASDSFDWLRESHQQSAPLAPLADTRVTMPVWPQAEAASPVVNPPLLPRPSFMAAPPTGAPVGVAPSSEAPRATAAPAATAPPPQAPGLQPVEVGHGGSGASGFGLVRHAPARRSSSGPVDWVALVLAIIVPPLGLLVAIAAMIIGANTRGFVAGVAKAALAIAIVLSVVAGVGGVVYAKVHNDQVGHDAIVASSAAWCTRLKANPETLASDTYGWPAPSGTIAASITSMQAYVTMWDGLVKVAPTGIRAGTTRVDDAAKSIVSSVTTTQTLDDSANISDMQAAVSNSGIGSWVSEYCK